VNLRSIQSQAFSSASLVPGSPPDGTSLQEKINAWVESSAGTRELVATHYQPAGSTYTAILFYAET
jgi:hypothetical protein